MEFLEAHEATRSQSAFSVWDRRGQPRSADREQGKDGMPSLTGRPNRLLAASRAVESFTTTTTPFPAFRGFTCPILPNYGQRLWVPPPIVYRPMVQVRFYLPARPKFPFPAHTLSHLPLRNGSVPELCCRRYRRLGCHTMVPATQA